MAHGETKTDIARRMLIERTEGHTQYDAIARASGLLTQSVRALAATMRNRGELPPSKYGAWEYVGTSDKLGVVRFGSLSKAQDGGFPACMVSKAVNGIIDSYAGYKWERVYL